MNKQNAAQYLPLVEALRDGELQIQSFGTGPWVDCTEVDFGAKPNIYRRRPKKRTVPLDPGDLPFPCAVRTMNDPIYVMVVEVNSDGVATYADSLITFKRMQSEWLYSATPNDPNSWRRCEKEVEE